MTLPVIASQRLGAKRRPMTGSAKQSMALSKRKNGLLRRFAPRNDGATWSGSDGLNLRWEDLHESLGHTLARHCERSEAIHLSTARKMDCFVTSLLAMTARLGPAATG